MSDNLSDNSSHNNSSNDNSSDDQSFRLYLRKIYIAVIAYLVSVLVGIMNARVLGIALSAASVPTSAWIVEILAQLVLMVVFSLWYFAKSPSPRLKEGVSFGITCIIVRYVIEILIAIPSIFIVDYPTDNYERYASPFFWLFLAVTVAVPAVIGRVRKVSSRK